MSNFEKIAGYLPKKEIIIESVLEKLAVIYKTFIDAGKFYEPVHHYEYGRCYTRMVEVPGLGSPYECIYEWLQEYTGEIGGYYLPRHFEDEMNDIIADIIYSVSDEVYSEYEEELFEFEVELREEIGSISIVELEKRIKDGSE